jgi:peptide/nickel transport system substrate-binding protein
MSWRWPVCNSRSKGGTLTFDWRSAPDSFDPGNTYFAADWDFARFYSQP